MNPTILLIIFLISISILLGIIILFLYIYYQEDKIWNNGKCKKCNGKWIRAIHKANAYHKRVYECKCDIIILNIKEV